MTATLSPDRLAALEEERDFLLKSLADLDAELAAGDIDEADHRALTDDYTARTAEVLRAIEEHREAVEAARPPRSRAAGHRGRRGGGGVRGARGCAHGPGRGSARTG